MCRVYLTPPGTPQGRYTRPFVAQRTTMAQTWWPRSSDYATCSTAREADSTAVTDLRDIDILSRAPQPCARFISTIISSLSASSNPTLLTDYTKGSRPTTTSRRVGSLFPYRYQHHSSTNDATSTIVSYRRRSTTPLSPLASRSLKIVHSLP